MLLLGLLLWCFVGALATGAAFELKREQPDPVSSALMTLFAPITVLYVVGALAMRLGQIMVELARKH